MDVAALAGKGKKGVVGTIVMVLPMAESEVDLKTNIPIIYWICSSPEELTYFVRNYANLPLDGFALHWLLANLFDFCVRRISDIAWIYLWPCG